MILVENWAQTLALAFVALACFLHLNDNVDRHSAEVEAWGFILTGAGAFALSIHFGLRIFWPATKTDLSQFGLVMHVGMALIALWLVAGRIRAWLASVPGLEWTDRRRSRVES